MHLTVINSSRSKSREATRERRITDKSVFIKNEGAKLINCRVNIMIRSIRNKFTVD